MDKLLCVAAVVLTVLVCNVSTVRSTAMSSKFVRKRACSADNANSSKECHNNMILPINASANKGQRVTRKLNHKKTKQSSSIKEIKRFAKPLQTRHAADMAKHTTSGSNSIKRHDKQRKSMRHSKAKKIRNKISKLSTKIPDISQSHAKLTKKHNKLLANNSEGTMKVNVKMLRKKRKFSDFKTVKGSAKSRPGHSTTQQDLNGKNKQPNKPHATSKNTICWQKRNGICSQVNKDRSCVNYIMEKLYTTKLDCEKQKPKQSINYTSCWQKKDGTCRAVWIEYKNCADFRLEKLYSTERDCKENKPKQSINYTSCWQKKDGTCRAVWIKYKNCADFRLEKLYSTERDCKGTLKKNKCYVLKMEKGVCEMEETTNNCSNHGTTTGKYHKTMLECYEKLMSDKCFKYDLKKKKCLVVEKITSVCDEKDLFKRRDDCIHGKLMSHTCYKYDLKKKRCLVVEKITSVCDEKNLFKRRDDCIHESRVLRHCFELKTDGTACQKITTYKECNSDASPYQREKDCLSTNGLTVCFQLNDDKSDCAEIRTSSDDCQEKDNRYFYLYTCEGKRQSRSCYEFNGHQCFLAVENFQQCSSSTKLFDTEAECQEANGVHRCYEYDSSFGICTETFKNKACTPLENTYLTQKDCENVNGNVANDPSSTTLSTSDHD